MPEVRALPCNVCLTNEKSQISRERPHQDRLERIYVLPVRYDASHFSFPFFLSFFFFFSFLGVSCLSLRILFEILKLPRKLNLNLFSYCYIVFVCYFCCVYFCYIIYLLLYVTLYFLFVKYSSLNVLHILVICVFKFSMNA